MTVPSRDSEEFGGGRCLLGVDGNAVPNRREEAIAVSPVEVITDESSNGQCKE